MSRTLAVFAALFGLATAASAGPLTVGARVGSSLPDLHGGSNEISSGYSSRLAPCFGVYVDYEISPRFSLQPEVDYAPQGGKRDGMQPVITSLQGFELPPGTTLYADFKNVAKLDYVEIPLLAKFRFGNGRRFFADLGPHLGILLSAKNVTSGQSSLYFDVQGTQPVTVPPGDPNGQPLPPVDFGATTDNKSSVRTFNWGVQGGAGVLQPFGPGDLFLDWRAGVGLTHIQKNTAVDGSSRTGFLVIALGYSYRLGGRDGD